MRVLVVHPGPHFSVADVYNGWVKGLGELVGHDNVETFDLGDWLNLFHGMRRPSDVAPDEMDALFSPDEILIMGAKQLEAKLYEWWPDLVVVVSGFFVPVDILDIIRNRGHQLVMIHTESPYEDQRQLALVEHVDLNIINDPTNIEIFRSYAPTHYIPHAFDPDRHRPGKVGKEYRSEVCFVGTGYPSRIAYLESIDWSGIDLALGGNWQQLTEDSPLLPFMAHDLIACMDNAETTKAYQGTLASFNLYRTETHANDVSHGWAIGPREVELAACGTWFARQSRPEGDDLFPMLPIFSTPDELIDQLRWALAHPDERQAAAMAARAAIADRTFTNNARQLLQLVGV